MIFWIKYGTQSDIRFPMVKRGVVDLAVSADWTPAGADSAISKDGGNFADTTNTVAIVGGSPTRSVAGWKLTISATEAQAAELNIQIVDAATKAVEDQFLTVYTYGNASAKVAADWSDIVRMGLTALPNAAAGANSGLLTCTTGNVLPSAAIVAASIGADAITAAKIADGAIDAATFAASAITATVIAADAITAAKIADGAIDAATFAAGAITAAAIATDAIDADALAADALAEIKTQAVAALNTDTYAEPAQGAPAATTTLVNKIGFLYKAWRNKKTQTSSTHSLFNDDAATVDHKSAVSDDGTTATRGEVASGP